MKKPIAIALLATILFLSAKARSETAEKIVAIVGSDIITLYDLDSAMAQYVGELKSAANKDMKYKALKSEVLEKLIDDRLLKQAISESKIEVTNEEVARQINAILNQSRITIDIFKAELAKKGISYESYKQEIKKGIERYKFMNDDIGRRIKITDAEMKDYYAKNMDQFGANLSVHIAQIVLPFDTVSSKEEAIALKAKAEELVKQTRSGTSFASLAKQHSKGPNSENGGDLGIIDPDNLLPEIQLALTKMRQGEISDPIVSPAGIHIIHLIDRGKPVESDFNKIKEKVYNKLYEHRMHEELNQYLTDLRRKTYIEIRE